MTGAPSAPRRALQEMGRQLEFYGGSLRWAPRTVSRYRREVWKVLSDVAFGSGNLTVIGGTVGVMFAMAFAVGAEVGLQGYAALEQLGASNFAAFLSAYFNTREAAPLVAGVALAATVGCGFTAQLGAMRVSEEIDALEVMAVPSLSHLVSTRMIAGFIAVVPLYAIGIFATYLASRTVTTQYYHQSPGTYDHYFAQYLVPSDVMISFGKALVFAVLVILIHCYYGFTASGGPAGVGVAVGRSIRLSIVAINLVDFFLSFAIWGSTTTVRITG